MRIAILVFIALFGISSIAPSRTAGPRERISVAELRTLSVIGELGVPLGTVVEIRAKVVSGSEYLPRVKGYDGLYLLKVTHVDGKELEDPVVLEFSMFPFIRVGLASNHFDLYALKTGRKAGELDSAEIRKLEKGYVGKTVHLIAYEAGRFSGIPGNLPKDVPVWAGRAFELSTSLEILAERKSPNE